MKITTIRYASLANLGNYENERIELEAQLEEGEDWESALEKLKHNCHLKLNNLDEYYKYCRQYREAKDKLSEIAKELQKAYEQWQETSNFLIAQGLKPSVPAFPILKENLIAPAVEEVQVELGDF
jgi:chromosome segregation ATPase